MADIPMQRASVTEAFESARAPHAGLWLARGLPLWQGQATRKGEDFQRHIAKAAEFPCPDIYKTAYERWERTVLDSPGFAWWTGKLEGRLFIGMGGASVLETAITLSKTYGVPMIPASAVKGLVRAYTRGRIDDNTCKGLFGQAGDEPDSCDAGYVIFHDAWWIPDSAKTPLAAEVVTVHHPEYYRSGGKPEATDFDAPIPNPQIAARGGFLFAVECAAPAWSGFARDQLAEALENWGIGGKTAAGYGYFVKDEKTWRELDERREARQRQARHEAKTPNQRRIAGLADKKTPDNKNGRHSAQLFGLLKTAIQDAADWPENEKAELHDVARDIFAHLGIKDAKKLLRGLQAGAGPA